MDQSQMELKEKTLDVSKINNLDWNAKIDLLFGLRNTMDNLDQLDLFGIF